MAGPRFYFLLVFFRLASRLANSPFVKNDMLAALLLVGWRPSLLGWRPSLEGGRPSLLGWRPSLLGELFATLACNEMVDHVSEFQFRLPCIPIWNVGLRSLKGKCGVYFVVIGANLNYALDGMTQRQWALTGRLTSCSHRMPKHFPPLTLPA